MVTTIIGDRDGGFDILYCGLDAQNAAELRRHNPISFDIGLRLMLDYGDDLVGRRLWICAKDGDGNAAWPTDPSSHTKIAIPAKHLKPGFIQEMPLGDERIGNIGCIVVQVVHDLDAIRDHMRAQTARDGGTIVDALNVN